MVQPLITLGSVGSEQSTVYIPLLGAHLVTYDGVNLLDELDSFVESFPAQTILITQIKVLVVDYPERVHDDRQ